MSPYDMKAKYSVHSAPKHLVKQLGKISSWLAAFIPEGHSCGVQCDGTSPVPHKLNWHRCHYVSCWLVAKQGSIFGISGDAMQWRAEF